MNDRVFLDTNIFVYLYSEDEPEKRSAALHVFEEYRCITSTQAMNEFCSVCLRKLRMTTGEVSQSIREIVEKLYAFSH